MDPETLSLQQRLPTLKKRALICQGIRKFFIDQNYLEVDTPIRLRTPALEDYIEAEPSGNCWLRTSPELHMKRLLAAGADKIFQLGPCFRQGEYGRQHLSEFTMLEWYRTHTDYRGILADTQALFRYLARLVLGEEQLLFRGNNINLAKDWEELSVAEAFQLYASCSLEQAMSEQRYEEVLCFEVEPHLGITTPTVLIDYPTEMAALARKKYNHPELAERWELYISGLEIANAYSELIDAKEQRERFIACAKLREKENRPVYPMDESFLSAMASGLPPCGGIAIGVDRLIMVLCNLEDIQNVVAFT